MRQMAETLRERTVDAWHRELNDGRVEIMCKSATHRIRVTAPEDEAWEAVELFEKWTGLTIASERRPRRRVPVLPGQLAMTELEPDSSARPQPPDRRVSRRPSGAETVSRFGDYDYEEYFPNQADLWQANARRALKGKRGRKALAELREALLALPERRLISGALCTVGGQSRPDLPEPRPTHDWYRQELRNKLEAEGEGVCAIGAFLWHKRVKAGEDPETAFAELPTLLDIDGGDYETAQAGRDAGLTFTLAWSLAYRNDATYEDMTPEGRFDAFLQWIDNELADAHG